jgi:hypothetical protein
MVAHNNRYWYNRTSSIRYRDHDLCLLPMCRGNQRKEAEKAGLGDIDDTTETSPLHVGEIGHVDVEKVAANRADSSTRYQHKDQTRLMANDVRYSQYL